MVPRTLPVRSLLPLAVLIALFLPLGARAQTDPCAGTFSVESPDTLGAIGFQSSLAVDAQGQAHIAYRNGSGSQIRYAHQVGGVWRTELLPQPGISRGLSLALDPSGQPAIGYGSEELTNVGTILSAKVARWDGTGWFLQRIESSLPAEVTVAFDPAGLLHAVYLSLSPPVIVRYATLISGAWFAEDAFATRGAPTGRFSLAFDSQGHPHLVAQVGTNLVHLVRGATGWTLDRMPAAEAADIVIDSLDVPHVAAHVRVPPDVQYRTRTNNTWSVESVDSVDAGGGHGVSLVMDRFGRPVLAYYDVGAGLLKCAWKADGVWNIRTLDVAGPGDGPSVALAGGIAPRISSMTPLGFDLRFVSGALPPPNHAPRADAGGPYAGTARQPIEFDASRSEDPEGNPLRYAWDFGDGAQGVGPFAAHAFASAGSYPVTLSIADVGCPSLADTAHATAEVKEVLEARVFRAHPNPVELVGDGARQCFQLEPVAGDFELGDLNPSTLVATFGNATAAPVAPKSPRLQDTDGDGAPEIEVCFLPAALRALFAPALPGFSRVTMGLEGDLRSGGRVRGELSLEILTQRDCRDGCVTVSPNPLNPEAALRFATLTAGVIGADLFDPQGRWVRSILPRTFFPPGEHEVRIEARDASGRPLASGLYFYRIHLPDRTLQGRLSIVK